MWRSDRAWNPLGRSDLGFLNLLSDLFATAERQNPGAYPHLRDAKCLLIASDYGGEHRAARYQTISFLISDVVDCAVWASHWLEICSRQKSGGLGASCNMRSPWAEFI